MSDPVAPFHLAFPVKDLDETYTFYTEVLGCTTGRTSDHWIDFNFWGHQVVAHLSPDEAKESAKNAVDGHGVPVVHVTGYHPPLGSYRANPSTVTYTTGRELY